VLNIDATQSANLLRQIASAVSSELPGDVQLEVSGTPTYWKVTSQGTGRFLAVMGRGLGDWVPWWSRQNSVQRAISESVEMIIRMAATTSLTDWEARGYRATVTVDTGWSYVELVPTHPDCGVATLDPFSVAHLLK